MKKVILFYLAFVLVVVIGVMAVVFELNYNSIVAAKRDVDVSRAQVEVVLQRRIDLVPNLVAVVKGYAQHEKETLTAVIAARNKAVEALKAVSGKGNPTSEDLAENAKAQDALKTTMSKLLMVVEAYPDLKANSNFLTLQEQLEGTENRIAVERHRYNDALASYNFKITVYPAILVAKIAGFKEARDYFKASEAAYEAPVMKF